MHLPPLPVGELVTDQELRAPLRLTGQADRLPTELSSGRRQREELDDRFDRVVHLPRTPART
ncbi:hypothetical protein AB0C27_29000 [Nonomuraea sp. NPDC048882]|uniref:hypothetical protein n=1 Tax=Nonomuraea sp. NPDC048882 TaxID=3154347 RepID=UPI0033C53EB5